ncbi:MAG: hypothetical protein ACKOKC_01895 [Chthoniobacterales bacterium]
MSREAEEADDNGQAHLECRFVAARNALLVSGDFAGVFMDCYLHLGRAGVVLRDGTDELLCSSNHSLHSLSMRQRARGTRHWLGRFILKARS